MIILASFLKINACSILAGGICVYKVYTKHAVSTCILVVTATSTCTSSAAIILQRGDNYKNEIKGWGHLKIFFSRINQNRHRSFFGKGDSILFK
jgi:hypothetical protein